VAITEYNYGAADQITGGLAEADFWGSWGRAACSPRPLAIGREARVRASGFRLFRNYDGNKGQFGTEVDAASASERIMLRLRFL